jgi:hypothetical protein
VLVDKGVTSLYHANSVQTACHFLRAKALLSRGSVERLGLIQTGQTSDQTDKRHSVWFDVFADSVDIHDRARTRNLYGPVLFVLDIDLLERTYTGRVWVTKLNPTKWKGKKRNERWFQSRNDLETNFIYGEFNHMIVFRHCGGAIPFGPYLRKVVLDDPEIKNRDGVDLFSAGHGALSLALADADLDIPISKRRCRAQCQCTARYRQERGRTESMFIPAS